MKNKSIYLCGAMESAGSDLGAGWREQLTPFLESLNFEVLDPCKMEAAKLIGLKPNRLPKYMTSYLTGQQQTVGFWHELKWAKEPHLRVRFLNYMRRIITFDIDIVTDKADMLVVFWDRFSSGSSGEITYAFMNGVPVYVVSPIELPAWIVGCSSKIFTDFDKLKKFLKKEYGYKKE